MWRVETSAEAAETEAALAKPVKPLSGRANRLAGFIFESELSDEPPPALIKGLLPSAALLSSEGSPEPAKHL